MANFKAFQGNLIHGGYFQVHFPEANVADSGEEDYKVNIEVYGSPCLSACANALPVLKSIDIDITPLQGITDVIADNGRMQIHILVWNINDDNVPDFNDMADQDIRWEFIGQATLWCGDLDETTNLDNEVFVQKLTKSYGLDGMVLRPNICVQAFLTNDSGTQIVLESFIASINLDIDWVPVSAQEFEDYLKELWLFQAVD